MRRVLIATCYITLGVACVYAIPALPAIALAAVGVFSFLRRPRVKCAPRRSRRDRPRRPSLLTVALMVCYLVWMVSLLTGLESASELVRFGFLRWQVRGFIGFLPLLGLLLARERIDPGRARSLWLTLALPAVAIALAGLLVLLAGWAFEHRDLAFRPIFVKHAEGELWFMGLARGRSATGGVYLTVFSVAAAVFVFAERKRRSPVPSFLVLVAVAWGLLFAKMRSFIGGLAVAGAVMAGFAALRFVRGVAAARPGGAEPGGSNGRRARAASALARGAACAITLALLYPCVPGLHGRMAATLDYATAGPATAGPEAAGAAAGGPEARRVPQAVGTIILRKACWRAAWRIFQAHPWTGVGLGNFPREAGRLDPELARHMRERSQPLGMLHAHNSYLHFLAETGLVGFAAFAAFIAALLRELLLATRRRTEGGAAEALALGTLAALAGHLAAALFDHNFWSPQIMIPLMTLAGIVISFDRDPAPPGGPDAAGAVDGPGAAGTDAERWDRFATASPRWYIATDVPEGDEEAFWESGRALVREEIVPVLEKYRVPKRAALEIGCGIGRLLFPLAARFERVTGADVSGEMIRLARREAAKRGTANARFVTLSPGLGLLDELEDARGEVDFVYSLLVFQHVEDFAAIERYLRDAAALLSADGVGYFQFDTRPGGALYWLKTALPDALLPRSMRRGIRRIRRSSEEVTKAIGSAGLAILESAGQASANHRFVVRRRGHD